MNAPKIDHRELQSRLKNDELVMYTQEFMYRAKELWAEYGKSILASIGIVIVVSVVFFLWNAKAANDFKESQLMFSNIASLIQQDKNDEALTMLDNFFDRFSSTALAAPARILQGSAKAKKGQYEMALQDFQSALSGVSGAEKASLQVSIAQTNRSLGKPDQALQILDSIEPSLSASKIKMVEDMKNMVAYMKAGCLEDLGQNDKALEAYKKIGSKSPWYSLAEERIDWLEAPSVKPVN